MLLHPNKFALGSVSNYSNTGPKTPTSSDPTSWLSAKRPMRFRCMVWIRGIEIFWRLSLFLIDTRHPKMNCSTLTKVFDFGQWKSSPQNLMERTVDPLLNSSVLFHIHYSASHGFHCYTLLRLVWYSPLCYRGISRDRISEWLEKQHFFNILVFAFSYLIEVLLSQSCRDSTKWVFLLKMKKIPFSLSFNLFKVQVSYSFYSSKCRITLSFHFSLRSLYFAALELEFALLFFVHLCILLFRWSNFYIYSGIIIKILESIW